MPNESTSSGAMVVHQRSQPASSSTSGPSHMPLSHHHRGPGSAAPVPITRDNDPLVVQGFGVTHIRHVKNVDFLFTPGGDRIPYKSASKKTPGYDATIYAQLEINGVAYPQRVDNFGCSIM
eukprot:PhM_4_TR10856/c0_g1_i1/m.86488